MVKISNLSYSYPKQKVDVIKDLNLDLKPGTICGLLGANGSGKSTLLYLICGLLKPKTGIVTFNGINTREMLPSVLCDMFIVPEDILVPNLKLSEYIKQNAPFYPKFSQDDMEKYLSHFNLSTDIHLGSISMGQKKKAFIAFALACNTSVLLMDEPTNGLDIPGKSEFRRAIVSTATEDRTIVISTHQIRDLDRVLDHVLMIDKTGILLNESIAELQQKYCFNFTTSPQEISKAIYVQPTAGGFNIITPKSEDSEETEINLESLFEYIYTNAKK